MTCDEILERLEAFVDGELDASERATIEAHLAGCEACAAEHALTEAVRTELRALPELDAPPAVIGQVLSDVGEDRFRRIGSTPSRPAWTALAAAALAAAVLGAAMLLGPSRQPETDEAAPMATTAVADATTIDRTVADRTATDPEAVARATEEARYALAYLAQVSRRTGLKLRDDLLIDRVTVPAARGLSRALLPHPEPPTGDISDPAAGDSDRS